MSMVHAYFGGRKINKVRRFEPTVVRVDVTVRVNESVDNIIGTSVIAT